ncbi:hypothetical protein ACJX0J_035312 [Zea mays]
MPRSPVDIRDGWDGIISSKAARWVLDTCTSFLFALNLVLSTSHYQLLFMIQHTLIVFVSETPLPKILLLEIDVVTHHVLVKQPWAQSTLSQESFQPITIYNNQINITKSYWLQK